MPLFFLPRPSIYMEVFSRDERGSMEPARANLPTILVVDDEPDITLALGDLLGNEGYQVDTVGTGMEALSRVSYSPL